jgi:hypothetical protein
MLAYGIGSPGITAAEEPDGAGQEVFVRDRHGAPRWLRGPRGRFDSAIGIDLTGESMYSFSTIRR